MKLRAALLCLFFIALSAALAAAPGGRRLLEEVKPRLSPPTNLLGPTFRWTKHDGDWQTDTAAAKATGAAGEKITELEAEKGVRLKGHWLSVKMITEGNAPKAGLLFSGVHDQRGELLRLVYDATTGKLTDGRGKDITSLPESRGGGVEFVLNFTNDKLTIHSGGTQQAELEVRFPEAVSTPSLFVERGKVTFGDLLLSGEPLADEPAVASAAPAANNAAPANAVPLKGSNPLAVDFSPEKMTALKSGWNEYLGVHFETAPGPWKMVRQFDGPGFARPLQLRHPADLKQFTGPFTGNPADCALSDFRDWQRKGARGLDENLAQLIRDDRAAIFIMPWRATFTPAIQDEVWALMKVAYGGNVGAEGRLYFQWGDDINNRHLGVFPRNPGAVPHGGGKPARGNNTPADAEAYAENYFAPAVEAVRRASDEIFHDARRIPILSGSCALVSKAENRAWFTSVLDHELSGASAPTLKGQRVIQLVDYLTVSYPFTNAETDAPLQEPWDRYGAQVKGLWVTEEFGAQGQSPGDLLARTARFLAWAARNQLDAQRARIIFNITRHPQGPNEAFDAFRSIGEAFGDGAVSIGTEEKDNKRIQRIRCGDGKMLVVVSTIPGRRPALAIPISEISLEVGEAQAAKPWIARIIQLSKPVNKKRPPFDKAPDTVPVNKEGTRLVLNLTENHTAPWAVLIEVP
jgi:hypothetical protein